MDVTEESARRALAASPTEAQDWRFVRRRGGWNDDSIVGRQRGRGTGCGRNRDRTKRFADRGDAANQRRRGLLNARRFFNERKASLIGSWRWLCMIL